MLLQTLINDCHRFRGFKYTEVKLKREEKKLEIRMEAKKQSKGRCHVCGKKSSTYDHQGERWYKFIPIWGYQVSLRYRPRRVSCKDHGVKIEEIPWGIGKRPIAKALAIMVSDWAKVLPWKEVGNRFRLSWDCIFESVKYVVKYGLEQRNLDRVKAIGIDEVYIQKKGRQFVTLVYEITNGTKRLLWIGQNRNSKTLLRFFRMMGKERYKNIKVVSSDMWGAYLKVIKKKLPKAIHVLDRFHIMKKFNEAIDETRRKEVLKQYKKNPNILKNTRWLFLKKPDNLTEVQEMNLRSLVSLNLKTYRAYLLREAFQYFWKSSTVLLGEIVLNVWIKMAMKSRIEPMIKVSKMLERHRDHLLNWFRLEPRVSNGVVEGFNNKVKVVMRRSYGFRTYAALEIALYHSLGNLPSPPLTHTFF